LFSSATDVSVTILVLLSGLGLCAAVGRRLALGWALIIAIYGWHTLHAFVYAHFILNEGGDAYIYYLKARSSILSFGLGTDFIVYLTALGSRSGLSFIAISMVYQALGSAGIIMFAAALRESAVYAVPQRLGRMLALVCLFLPSLSFWTSGLGKDSLAMLGTGMFIWGVRSLGRRLVVTAIAISIVFLVRPHIAALMIIGTGLGVIFLSRASKRARFATGVLALCSAAAAVPAALIYASGSASLSNIDQYVEQRQGYNLEGGSSVDIGSMNPLLRLPSFLYRPLPQEAENFAQLASAFDNMFLLVLTFLLFTSITKIRIIAIIREESVYFFYGLGSWIVLSQVTANLGIAVRQKWMFVPALMLFCLSGWAAAKRKTASENTYRISNAAADVNLLVHGRHAHHRKF
jgi:hypothetical protein